MAPKSQLPIVPASFFGIVLGLCGLGSAWRLAGRAWGMPPLVGELLFATASVVWVLLLMLFGAKWIVAREQALQEACHPVQCCFIGLAGVSTMVVASGATPYSRTVALALSASGGLFVMGFTLWRTGILWQGGREQKATTAVLYLPSVAGSFVTAIQCATLGSPAWGQLAFGAAFFSWLAIESVLLNRLYHGPELPLLLRPTLGIQLAPPTVGLLALLSLTDGPPGFPAYAMFGYGLLQLAILVRMVGWLRQQSFIANYWGFSFGATALGAAPLVMVIRGDTGPALVLAPYLFVLSNLFVAMLVVGTISLWWRNQLLPSVAPIPGNAR